MTDKATDTPRIGRLDGLSISGFRGIDQLAIPKLGRVALLAGQNGVGKTTVLDAVQLYASCGRIGAVHDLLMRREELTAHEDEDGHPIPDLSRLFHDNSGDSSPVVIGPRNAAATLEIVEKFDDDDNTCLSVTFDGTERIYPEQGKAGQWSRRVSLDAWALVETRKMHMAPTRCEAVGPGLLNNSELARLWDGVALTDGETVALDALRLVFGDQVERAAVIGHVPRGRRVVVRLSDHANPVPLKSLGDGATRMFTIALALANCRDGILLIDEAENGIHHLLQSKFWELILRAAEVQNVQVLAATHSKDCIDGFSAAALDCPDVDGNLICIGWRNDELRAVSYSTEELDFAAEHHIEVR